MIAVDSSSFIAYLAGDKAADTEAVETALEQKLVVFPPVVLTELLSDAKVPQNVRSLFKEIPLLTMTDGYWERAGLLRSEIIRRGLKARLADTLVAQSCLDHHVSLITRDPDFRHFVRWAGLKRI
ncbi:MAG: PIN domain-containing protein [Deltaproteobacteria bacterium]|nr:PIN domain-containing protein [Deltaproteobacteria bacterium]